MAAPPPPQLLDQRGIGKCKGFSGKREDFEKFIFPFESYCALLGWESLMIAARDETTEIDNDLLNDDAKAISRSLYHLLVSLCEGMAMNIVKLTERGNGFEALRKLYKEFRPKLAEEAGALLQAILTPTWWKERKCLFTETLVAWDDLIERYRLATSENITDNMKCSTILAHAPEMVKVILRSAPAEVRRSHLAMRTCIWEAVVGLAASAPSILAGAATTGSSNDMDVDAIGKGRGKDVKCHNCGKSGHYQRDCWFDPTNKGKGKCSGKSKGKGKGGGSGSEKFAGKCNHCKKTGHKAADCRLRIAEEKRSGTHAVTEDAKGVEAIEIASDGDDEDFWCMTLEASGTAEVGLRRGCRARTPQPPTADR